MRSSRTNSVDRWPLFAYVLVYTHREDSPHHQVALHELEALAARRAPWAIPWPCLHQFRADRDFSWFPQLRVVNPLRPTR